ncbi:MAG TPA: hypothetical protein DCR69_05080 [Clostridium sp.]|nr:hypothetical protein [Clostridium sp.]
MASRKYVLAFRDSAESKFNLTISDGKEVVQAQDIVNLMDNCIGAESIFNSKNGKLVEKLSAIAVDTSETTYEIN